MDSNFENSSSLPPNGEEQHLLRGSTRRSLDPEVVRKSTEILVGQMDELTQSILDYPQQQSDEFGIEKIGQEAEIFRSYDEYTHFTLWANNIGRYGARISFERTLDRDSAFHSALRTNKQLPQDFPRDVLYTLSVRGPDIEGSIDGLSTVIIEDDSETSIYGEYYFDHEGHFGKTIILPIDKPDKRPVFRNFQHVRKSFIPVKEVVETLTPGHFETVGFVLQTLKGRLAVPQIQG